MTENRKNVVIYGAGAMAPYAIQSLSSDIYNVVAVCDSDESKAGGNVCNIPIMSQQMVRKKFGEDFFVYVSPNSPVWEEIQAQIVRESFVTRDRIINYKDTRTYLSCNSLENVVIVENQGLLLCCNLEGIRNAAPRVPWESSESETVNSFLKRRDKYIEDLQRPHAKGPCDNCPDLCMAEWNADRKVNILSLSFSYPCQLSCIYCDLPTNGKHFSNREEELKKACGIDINKLLDALKRDGKLRPSEPVQISGGEITVSPKKEELLNAVSEYPLQIFTNGILYDEKIAELTARDDGSYLNISLDAGTKRTYCLVKGLDVWEKVCETLRKYRNRGSHILLKYIILPENCSKDDFDGFIALVKEIKPISVSIACDVKVPVEMIPQSIVEGAIYMGIQLQRAGIWVNILPYFGKDNLDYIHSKMKEEEVVL